MIASLHGPAVQSLAIFSDRPLSEIRREAVQWHADLRIVVGCSVACTCKYRLKPNSQPVSDLEPAKFVSFLLSVISRS